MSNRKIHERYNLPTIDDFFENTILMVDSNLQREEILPSEKSICV